MSWRDEVVTSPYGRGDCSVCEREFNLTRKGVLRDHRNLPARNPGYGAPHCDGSGEPPKPGATP